MKVLFFSICILLSSTVFIESSNVGVSNEVQSYRLPNNSIPLRYDLWLKTDIDKGIFDFSGRVKILLNILSDTQSLTLHIDDSRVDKIDLVDEKTSEKSENLQFQYNEKFQFLVIDLPRIFNENEKLTLDIQYRGKLRSDHTGFYHGSYQNPNNETVWYATTKFQPVNARHVMPCYDEPQIRAVINVQIEHVNTYNAISNMPIDARQRVARSDYVTSKFHDTPPIPTYLLAFVVSDFKFTSDKNTKIEQRIYAKPQAIEKKFGNFALGFAELMMIEFNRLFDFDYPLKKLDHVAVSEHDLFASVNFGLITYRGNTVLFNQGTLFKKAFAIESIAHRQAQQFFGGLVSVKWWSYSWMHTGLAAMYERYLPSLVAAEGDYDFMAGYTDDYVKFTMEKDDKTFKNQTLTQNVETIEEIEDSLSRMRTRKARSIFWMFHEAISKETFSQGLKYYLTSMKYSAATPDDLYRELQKAFDEDFRGDKNSNSYTNIGAAMKTWEEQSGYPVVYVEKLRGKFILTQERYGGGPEIYTIPITYATKSSRDFKKLPKIWMKMKTLEIDQDEWILLNVGWNGYYKVSYSEDILNVLAVEFSKETSNVPVLDKNEIFEMVFQLLIKSKIDAETGLNFLLAAKNSKDFSTWKKTEKIFQFFQAVLHGAEVNPKFQKFIRSTVTPILSIVRFEPKVNESTNDEALRQLITQMSCAVEQPSCLSFELRKLENFLSGFGDSVTCEGVKQVNSTVRARIDFLLSMGKMADVRDLQSVLGCSVNRQDILKDLQMVFKAAKLPDDSKVNLFGVIQKRSVISAVAYLEFVHKNAKYLIEKIPGALKLIYDYEMPYIYSNYNSEKLRAVLFQMKAANLIDEEALIKAEQRIDQNLLWNDKNSRQIDNWMGKFSS